MTPDERARSAYHEGAHSLLAVVQSIPLKVASLRPGQSFRAVTLLGPAEGNLGREETERRITVLLGGDIGQRMAEPIVAAPRAVRPTAIVAETDALAGHTPDTVAALRRAESESESESDEAAAYRRALMLANFDESIAAMHLNYLRVWTLRIVERHRRALRQLAAELYARTVLDGIEIESITRRFRCGCHLDWPGASASGTQERKPIMPSLAAKKAPPKAQPPDRYAITAGFVAVLDDRTPWAPPIGSVWPSTHAGIRHMLAHGAEGTYLLPVDQADEPTMRAARAAAESFPIPEPEPEPVATPKVQYRCLTETVVSVGVADRAPRFVRGVQPGELVAEDDWIVQARPDNFEKVEA